MSVYLSDEGIKLAEQLTTTDEQKDTLDLITTFNINARYPDYKQSFYKKCDVHFTTDSIKKIEELRTWLILIFKYWEIIIIDEKFGVVLIK